MAVSTRLRFVFITSFMPEDLGALYETTQTCCISTTFRRNSMPISIIRGAPLINDMDSAFTFPFRLLFES